MPFCWVLSAGILHGFKGSDASQTRGKTLGSAAFGLFACALRIFI